MHTRRILTTLGSIAIALSIAVPLLLGTGGTTASGGSMMEGKTGDLNVDGVVNSIDALLVLFYDAGLSQPPAVAAERWFAAADVNCDQTVDSLDASLILQSDAGLYDLRP